MKYLNREKINLTTKAMTKELCIISNKPHTYIPGDGDLGQLECKNCGLLKTTIEADHSKTEKIIVSGGCGGFHRLITDLNTPEDIKAAERRGVLRGYKEATDDIKFDEEAAEVRGMEKENKEWREGRRCEMCGKGLTNTGGTNMCDDCWEDA